MRRGIGWLGLVAIVFLGACGESASKTDPPIAEGQQSAEVGDSGVRCDFPRVAPTYLPWSGSGPPDAPRRTYDREIDRAQMVWIDPKEPQDQVALTVYPADIGSDQEPLIGVRIEGAEGHLHHGEGGETGAWWDLDEECNFLELAVSLQGATQARLDREVVKIARSLE